MVTSEVEHFATVESALTAAPQVTLYNDHGRRITVDEADVDYWLGQGFRREKLDVLLLRQEVLLALRAAVPAVERFVDVALADGVLDPDDQGDYAAACMAMAHLVDRWNWLNYAVSAQFPVAQGEGVLMRAPDGLEHRIDPGQVATYEAEGFSRA